MKKQKYNDNGFRVVLAAVLLATLTGCIGYVDGHHHGAAVYVAPAPVYVETGVVVVDDYVYYPGYQVYYSSSRRQYVYLEGRSWVTRPAPPRVSVDVLFASPSVRLEFHDAPSVHHASVVKRYPKHWAPPAPGPGHGDGHPDNGNNGRK